MVKNAEADPGWGLHPAPSGDVAREFSFFLSSPVAEGEVAQNTAMKL